MASLSRRAWLQYTSFFVLLVVLAAFGLWYVWYVRERRESLVGRNLRLVEAIATHIEKSLAANRRALDKMLDEASAGNLDSVDPRLASPVERLRALFRDRSFQIQLAPAPSRPRAQGGVSKEIEVSTETFPLLELRKGFNWPAPHGPHQVISVKIDLSQLLKKEKANDADGQPVFADLVMLDSEGKVLAQRDAPGGQLFRLPPPVMVREKGFERVGIYESLQERSYVFRQVIHVEGLNEVIVCGLVPVARFDEVARWLSTTKQLLLGLAVLLAALSLPLMRINFDPDRSVSHQDLGLAGVAGIAGVAVLTLVIIDVTLYRHDLARGTDLELRNLTRELRARFLDELGVVAEALAEVPRRALNPDDRSHGDLFSTGRFQTLRDHYPFVSELALIGPTDYQITRWSRDAFSAPLRDVGDRAYVRDFRNGRTWSVRGHTLVSQHLRSKSRGVKETVVGIPLPDEAAGAGDEPGGAGPGAGNILSVTAEMISVNTPVLPRGYEFALYDRDGEVVYHSVAERSIDENLFEEVDEPRPFRLATLREPFDTWYRGREYRATVVRVGETDLSLAVLRDQTPLQNFNRWFIERTAIAGVVLLGVEFIVLLLTWRASRRDRAWCLPEAQRLGRTVAALLLVAALVGLVLASRGFLPAQSIWVSVGGALAGIIWCWYLLAHFPHPGLEQRLQRWMTGHLPDGSDRETTRVMHVLLVTMALVLVAVLPTMAVADLTYRWSLEQELNKEVVHLQREWRARERDIVENYGRTGRWLMERRREDRRDLYPATVGFSSSIGRTCQPLPEEARGGLAVTAPFLAGIDSIAQWLVGRPSPIPLSDAWHGSFDSVIICAAREPDAFQAFVDPEDRVARAEAHPRPSFGGWRRWTILVAGLFLACFWAVGLFQRRVALSPCPPRTDEGTAPPAAPTQHEPTASPAARAEAVPAPSRRSPFHWRWLMALILLAASVFIYLTQQIGSLALVTGLASILPILLRISDSLHEVGRGEQNGPRSRSDDAGAKDTGSS